MAKDFVMTQNLDNNRIITEQINQLNKKISKNKQMEIVQNINSKGLFGQEALLNLLQFRRLKKQVEISLLDALIFDVLFHTDIPSIYQKLYKIFPNGLVELSPTLKINYQYLQNLLMNRQFQEADRITQKYLCKLAGLTESNQRQWLYFTDISLLPSEDLFIIDLLWRIYSQGKFGFSIQRQIWLSNNKNWEILWDKIGWTNNGRMRRYPIEFIWEIEAPKGHLPLFNQLRGIQVLLALFQHMVWTQKNPYKTNRII